MHTLGRAIPSTGSEIAAARLVPGRPGSRMPPLMTRKAWRSRQCVGVFPDFGTVAS